MMNAKLEILILLTALTVGCSTLGGLALDAISPDKGGIDTEIVVGDKVQTLGTNQDVKAGTVGKVVGSDDNSTAVASAEEVTVTNINIPSWLIGVLLGGLVLAICLPTPTTMWKYFRRSK